MVAAGAGCGVAADEPAEEAVVEQSLSTFRIALFFSDPELTQMVGERSSLCTSTSNWGVRTPWVYMESGSCEWDYSVGPAEWPDGEGACVCCNDSNGDGTCDGDPSFQFCSSSFNCF
ncbi:MAG: hypothetical protein WKG01_16210 [Kofleriaceae bacterium]